MDKTNTKVMRSSFLWVAVGNYSNRILGFVSTLILAAVLEPEQFGVVAIAQMVIELLYLCKDLGVSQALIYRRDSVEEAAGTGLILTVGVNTGLFLVAAMISPLVASYYQQPILVPVIIALSSNLIWIALNSVPDAVLRKRMQFDKLVMPNVVPVIIASAVSIALALAGFGVWSLVIRTQLIWILQVPMVWLTSGLRPVWRFDRQIAKELLGYGKYIVGSSIILVLLYNVDKFYVSQFEGIAALGLFTLASRIASLPVTEFSHLVCRVIFPAFSAMNEDAERLRLSFLKTLRYSAIVSIPMAVGIGTFGPAVVRSVYGDKWAGMGAMLQILSVYALLRSFSTLIAETFKATGRPWLMQRFEFLRLLLVSVLGIPAILQAGTIGLCVVIVFAYLVVLLLELRTAAHVLGFRLRQLGGVFAAPAAIAAVVIPLAFALLSLSGAGSNLGVQAATGGIGALAYILILSVVDPTATADVRRILRV
jgi:O-antigen/teichoic acid export membrane protein